MTYNGWKNYETWAVSLYLDGNYTGEGTYRDVLAIADDVISEIDEPTSYATIDELRQQELASRLKDYVDECESFPRGPASLAHDLFSAALFEVDWDELAKGKLEEVTENA